MSGADPGTPRKDDDEEEEEEYRTTPSPKSELSCSPARSGMTLQDEIEDAERRKEERVRQQLERAAAPKSSWGSWGNVWSSVTSSVTSTVSSVTSTVTSVTSTVTSLSENLAEKVLDIIDDVEEKLGASDEPKPADTASASSTTTSTATLDTATAATAESSAPAFSASPVAETPRKPTLSELLKEAKEAPPQTPRSQTSGGSSGAPPAADSSGDILANVIQAIDIDTAGLKEIGSSLVETSAEVLESLGRTALSLLGDDRAIASAPASAPQSAPTSPRSKSESRQFCFGTLFEDCMGKSDLDALQLLSRSREKIVLSRLQGVPSTKRSKLDTDLAFIKEQLTADEDEEHESPDADSRREQFVRLMKSLSELAITKPVAVESVMEARARCDECIASWRTGEPLAEKESGEFAAEADNVGAIAGVGTAAAEASSSILGVTAHHQALHLVSRYAARFVKALRHAAELLLHDASNGASASAEDLKRKASVLRDATLLVADDLAGFGEDMGDAIKAIEQRETREKAQSLLKNLFLEIGDADAAVKDALAFIIPVLQSLLFSA